MIAWTSASFRQAVGQMLPPVVAGFLAENAAERPAHRPRRYRHKHEYPPSFSSLGWIAAAIIPLY